MKLSLILSVAIILTFSSNVIQSLENVGCLFSDDLCEQLEVCLDDNAFGRCEGVDDLDGPQISVTYQHSLNAKTLKLLENEMQRLYISGYRWDNEYTQCVIKQILYTHRLGINYDPGLCSRLLKLYSPHIAPETSIDLTDGKLLPNPLADIEFIPDYESDFAKEVFSRLNDKNKYNFKTKKREENKVEIDSKVFTFLKKLIEKQLENDGKYSETDELPDHKISLMETDFSSDLTQKPVYSEAGVQWLPIDSDNSVGIGADDLQSDVQKSILDSMSALSDGDLSSDSADQPIFLQPLNRDSSESLTLDTDNENDFWDALETGQNDDQILVPDDSIALIGSRSFPRQHRYDTKKPGPGYYIHEMDSQELDPKFELSNGLDLDWDQPNEPSDEQMANWSKSDETELEDLIEQELYDKNGGQKEQIHPKEQPLSYLTHKKSSNKAYKPVSEGPVKVEIESKDSMVIVPAEDGERTRLEAIDTSYAFVVVDKPFGEADGSVDKFVTTLEQLLLVPKGTFSNVRTDKESWDQITFKVNPNRKELNASLVVQQIEDLGNQVKNRTGRQILKAGIGYKTKLEVQSNKVVKESLQRQTTLTLTLCGLIMVALVAGVLLFLYRRNAKFREKLQGLTSRADCEASQDYQDLCRQRMQNKSNEKQEPMTVASTTGTGVHSTSKLVSKLSQSSDGAQASPPSRSSTSSWNEEPVASNMDISTGHIILSYMEDHLKKKDRLDREWEALCAYEADPCSTHAASLPQNAKKNRYPDVLPYDHSRVILNDLANISGSDFINANTITDHDPRNPAYIATQGPLPHTAADFWQMVWEQGSVIIVMLTRLMENGVAMCHRYWPEEGSELYHNYEVHLVSEHIWCDDYLVRSFYLKNLKTSETRTVTQFHFLSWPENGVPPNAKSILEFRRKVNKSYRGRSCPIVTHCSDGTGRTGTYTLIDMVLNRMSKGAKEIDIAATLEHIRDQRMGMVKTKAQFEYVLTSVAEEVQAILKALAQN